MDPNLVLTLVGSAAAVIAVVQTARANRLNRLIAKQQGALDSPSLSVRFLGQAPDTRFVVALPLMPSRIVDLPLYFDISNSGAKSAKDLELVMRLPKELLFGGSEFATLKSEGPAHKPATVSVVAKSENLESLVFSVASLSPGQTARLELHVSIRRETFFRDETPVIFKDGSKADIPYLVHYQWHVNFSLFQADRPPIPGAACFEVVNSHTEHSEEALADWHRFLERTEQRFDSSSNTMLLHIRPSELDHDPTLPIDRVSPEHLHLYAIGLAALSKRIGNA